MSFGNFFFEKIPKTGEQSITYSKEIDYFLEIINFFNAIWLHSRNFDHFKFVEILADFKKVRGGKSPEKLTNLK